MYIVSFLLVTALGFLFAPAGAQPQMRPLGLACSQEVDPESLPRYMAAALPKTSADMQEQFRRMLSGLGRFSVRELAPHFADGRYTGPEADTLGLLLHVELRKLNKIFRNRMLEFVGGRAAQTAPALAGEPQNYEVSALPVIIGQLQVRLLDTRRGKTLWSGRSDTTLVIPRHTFIYNPRKYPGWTPPELLQGHLAGIVRLQDRFPAIGSMLHAADRWYVSDPAADLDTAARALELMVQAFYTRLDGNLPLEGRISRVLPPQDGKHYAELNIGAHHGLTAKLRLDVRRPGPEGEKVGQVEVVQVDSLSSVIRLRKLERGIRRLGQGLQEGDRAISAKRDSPRRPGAF